MKPLKERKSSDPRGLAYKISAASHAANPSYGPHDPTLDPKTNFGAAATRASAVSGLRAARKIKQSQGNIHDPEHIETISKNIHGAPEDFGGVARGWSSAALTNPNQTDVQRERRAKLTVPYDTLSDEEKEKDRQIAKVVTGYMNEACWDGYKQVGMKEQNGKMVPNCVPMEEGGLKDVVDDLRNYGRIQAATIGKQPGEKAEFLAKIRALQAKKKAKTTAVAENEINEYCPRCLIEVLSGQHPEQLGEAQYQGRSVPLGKPMRGDVKKFKVFVRDPQTGNIKKVNFGDKTMRIKKSNPARRRSFRARHRCSNPGPRTKARYWSCRKW